MTWTRNKPTEPGWYWYKPNGGGACVVLITRGIRETLVFQRGGRVLIGLPDGAWSGPIPEPEEPQRPPTKLQIQADEDVWLDSVAEFGEDPTDD